MKKFLKLIKLPLFWLHFLVAASVTIVIELFMLGIIAIPVINYSINYMSEIKIIDILFIVAFGLTFGFAITIWNLHKKNKAASCALFSTSGLLSLFTLLCPVCPIFFLSFFGFSATLILISPHFWLVRIFSLLIVAVGIFLIWRNFSVPRKKKLNTDNLFAKIALLLITILLINNQNSAIAIGQKLTHSQTNHQEISISGDFSKDVATLVTLTQTPFYASDLGLDFSNLDTIDQSIKKLAQMAPYQGNKAIQLSEEEMKRYIAIGTEPYITCEFCCGVKTLVTDEGQPTCGCAHSIAMRGTAAFLITNYPELSDADISYELMRQKGLYFPTQMQKRMAEQLAGEKENFTADIRYLVKNLDESKLNLLQTQAKESGLTPTDSADMVGGC